MPSGRTEKRRLAVPSGDEAIPGSGEGILKPLRRVDGVEKFTAVCFRRMTPTIPNPDQSRDTIRLAMPRLV